MNKKATRDISLNIPSAVKQRTGEIYGSHCDGDETKISHSNSEMKKQSIVWEHSGLPKPKKFKQMFHCKKLMATDFWGQKRCFVGGIHESRSNNHIGIVLWDITIIKKGDSKQTVWPTDFGFCVVAWQRATPQCCAHTQLLRQFKWESFKASAIQSGPGP